jgi:hypothetical protein
MKRKIEFLDKEKNKVVVNCEITTRNGYEEFTTSGEYKNGLGQIFDKVIPDGENQQKLIDLWNKWHLKEIDEDFEDELDSLLDNIEQEEEEKQEREVEETDIDLFEDFNKPECALALALMLELSVSEIEDIVEESDNRWCVQGVDYLAGTDEEMDEKWDEDLENYIDECILSEIPEPYRFYFDNESWKSDARNDGRAHSLNRYNSGELEQKINETWYYAYRQ